jgi:hypothetical protein
MTAIVVVFDPSSGFFEIKERYLVTLLKKNLKLGLGSFSGFD